MSPELTGEKLTDIKYFIAGQRNKFGMAIIIEDWHRQIYSLLDALGRLISECHVEHKIDRRLDLLIPEMIDVTGNNCH